MQRFCNGLQQSGIDVPNMRTIGKRNSCRAFSSAMSPRQLHIRKFAKMATEIIKAIAEILPVKQVYDDALSPAAKQVGAIGEDTMKAIRLALAPIQYVAAQHDRFVNFIDNSVRNVPEDRRVTPPPQIVGPVLEGIRYEPEETPIDEMFSTLLSNSMDSESFEKAHPSFPYIIRQLSRDEAVILKELKYQKYSAIETFDINPEKKGNPEKPHWINRKIEKELQFPLDKLWSPRSFQFYVSHLFYLGFSGFTETRDQEVIFDVSGKQTGVRKFQDFHLMELGRSFVEACLPDDTEENKLKPDEC